VRRGDRGLWKTKDGRTLRIRDMGEEHLRNTIAMLDRQIARCKANIWSYEWLRGEMAREAAAGPVVDSMFMKAGLVAKRRELQAELDRR